jgi:CHAD domain-containing protein
MRVDLRLLKKLLAADNASVLLEGFEQRRRAFDVRVRKARRKPSEGAIHNVRVAARRLLSMLALLEAVIPRKKLREVRDTIGDSLRDLRKMRDVQVQLSCTETLLRDFPQLTEFHRALTDREKRLKERAQRQLNDFDLKQFQKRTDRILERLIDAVDPETDLVLGHKIGASVEDAYRRVLSLRARIDPDWPRSIHRTRLAFKKFRYMAEIVAPAFDELTVDRLLAMHDFQDRMGAIQDLDSLLARMMAFRQTSDRTSLLVVENEIRRRRRRMIEDFIKSADEVRFFWSIPPIDSAQTDAQTING